MGPFLDKTDGVTPEVAITVTACKLTFVVDDGGVPTLILDTAPTASGGANDMVHITGDDAGYYDLEFAAADVNYFGRAKLAITDAAVHCPVFQEFMIVPANIYDAMFLGTDLLDVSMVQILGTAVSTPATAGILDCNVKNIDNDAASASGTVTFPNATLASTVNITAGTIATVTNLTNAPTAGDFTATMKTSIGTAVAASAVASVTADVNVAGLDPAIVHADLDDIQSRLPAALTAGGNIKAGVQGFLDTVFTEGAAGRIAAAFKQFFNIATPAATMDHGILVDTVTTLTNAPSNSAGVTTLLANVGTPSNLGSGASLAGNLVDVEAQTDDIGVAGAGLTAITGKTDNLPSDPADESLIIAATDAIMNRIGSNGSALTSVALSAAGVDAILDDAIGDGSITMRQAIRVILAVCAAKLSGAATTTITIRNVADSANIVVATVDADGNRTAVTVTP